MSIRGISKTAMILILALVLVTTSACAAIVSESGEEDIPDAEEALPDVEEVDKTTTPPTPVPQNYAAIVSPPALWTQLSPAGTAPTPREKHASVYDVANDRLIIFGGKSSSEYFNDTWVLTNASGTNSTPSWIYLSTAGTIPTARYAVVAAYNSSKNMLIVFGGVDSSNKIQMDLWGLTNANGLQGDTSKWSKLAIDGTPPTARAYMAGAYDETSDTLMLFGGGAYSSSAGTLYDETWTIRDVTSNPSWHKLNPAGTLPTARRDASAVYDAANNRLIVFGGNTSTANPPTPSGRTNDTWVLSNANGTGGTPTCSQLNTLDKPPARSRHTAIFDSASKRMVVFAGTGTDNYVRGDVWVLTNPGETTSSWAKYDAGRPRPTSRVYHSAVYTGSAKNRMIIFGGDTGNGNLVNDVWVLRNASGIPETPVRDISIKAASTSLCMDYTLQLTPVASGASDNEVSGVLYTWSSSDPGIATVSSTGLVKGAGPGTATVTVTFLDVSGQTITSQFVITIADVPATEVTPPTGTEPVTPPTGILGKSVYDGTYIGMFTYEYQEHRPGGEGEWITDGFRLTVTFKHIATALGITTLEITKVVCSDPHFGTGLAGITPSVGSVATLPAEPPTTPMNPSQAGMGIAILFPNGAALLTSNRAGALRVSSDGRTLSNSLDPGIQDETWVAGTPQGPLYSGDPSGVYRLYNFKSWSLTKSNL